MKSEKKKQHQDKGTKNIIQKKEGNSFVKPVGDTTKFSPPSTSGKRNKSLPSKLQSNMESSLGHDFSNVGIQTNSHKAVQMNARAFTQNEQIHFAPGEFNPSSTSGQNLIGHEFTHIAQQRAGVVKPTKRMQKGVMVNDDRSLESEADTFGRKAARGEVISKYRSASLGMRSSVRTAQAKSNIVQMATTHYGEFKDESYTTIKNSAGKEIGVDMYIKFTPGNNVDAKLIGMVQTVRSVEKGKPFAIGGDATIKGRMIDAKDSQPINSPVKGTDEGIQIDQAPSNRNPLYAVEGAPATDTKLSQGPTPGPVTKLTAKEKAAMSVTGVNYKGWGQHGYRYKSGKAWKSKDAELHDAPRLGSRTTNAEQLFETTALAIDGNQNGTYYGSVEWGWRTDAKGNFSRIPFTVKSEGTPSSSFMKAAEIWNTQSSSSGASNLKLPTQDVHYINNFMGVQGGLGPLFTTIPYGTRVVITNFVDMTQSDIRVVDGPLIGETATVNNSDLTDERN